MDSSEELVKAGFTEEQAARLSTKAFFRSKFKNKTAEQFDAIVEKISSTYFCSPEKARSMIVSFPPLAALNHDRVMRELLEVYSDETAVRKAVLAFPWFAGRNHAKLIVKLTRIYGDEEAVKRAVLKSPSFVGHDHKKLVAKLTRIYGDEEAVKRALLIFHLYSYDQDRLLQRLGRIGHLIGLDEEQVKRLIMKNPRLVGNSPRRLIAALDVGRELAKEGIPNDSKMLEVWLELHMNSPYVPGTDRLRISKARRMGVSDEEPPLTNVLRRRLGGNQTRNSSVRKRTVVR
ncbi:Uncharacterised protein [Candidatus Norongarragalina meridionalis]|nr:Uncharacterised protein [Candidatus Norongarragalina meridionalis]